MMRLLGLLTVGIMLCSQSWSADVGGYYIRYECTDQDADQVINDTGTATAHATLVGGNTVLDLSVADQRAVANSAFDLDGSADYFTVPEQNAMFTDSFTITMWIKPDDGQPAATDTIYGGHENGGDYIIILHDANGDIRCGVGDGTNTANTTSDDPVFADGATSFTHIAFRADNTGDKGDIFVDGSKVTLLVGSAGDFSSINFAGFDSQYTEAPFVGDRNYSGSPIGQYWPGHVSDVRIYKSSLTDQNIQDIYDATKEVQSSSRRIIICS